MTIQLVFDVGPSFLAYSIQQKLKSVSLSSTLLFTLFIQVGFSVLIALSTLKEW